MGLPFYLLRQSLSVAPDPVQFLFVYLVLK